MSPAQGGGAFTVTWTVTGSGADPAMADGDGSDLAETRQPTGTVVFAANDTTAQPFTIATRNDTRGPRAPRSSRRR